MDFAVKPQVKKTKVCKITIESDFSESAPKMNIKLEGDCSDIVNNLNK